MSIMFEVLYKSPPNPRRETAISERVQKFGGRLTYREEPHGAGSDAVCLTYEFSDRAVAEQAASDLRQHGEHVEGPMDYGE